MRRTVSSPAADFRHTVSGARHGNCHDRVPECRPARLGGGHAANARWYAGCSMREYDALSAPKEESWSFVISLLLRHFHCFCVSDAVHREKSRSKVK